MTAGHQVEHTLAAALFALGRLTSRARLGRWLGGGRPELSATDSWLLDRLLETGGARMSELARWQAVDRSTMTSQVNKLERMGLVQRVRDASDRRAVAVSLQEQGRVVAQENRRAAREAYAAVVADWTAEEKAQLARSLSHLVESLERQLRA